MIKSSEPNLIACCLATSINAGGHNMIQSMIVNNWNFQIIGKDMSWTGWSTKMQAYLECAKTQKDQNTIIVFLDCYDMLCLRDSNNFIKLFESFNADVVVGGTPFCLPWNCSRTELNETQLQDQNYCYVNTGFVAGRAFALVKIYEWAIANKETDDQKAVCRYMNSFKNHKIKVDIDKFLVFNDSTDIIINKPVIKCSSSDMSVDIFLNGTKIQPYFIHFPGFLVNYTFLFFWKFSNQTALQNYTYIAKHLLKERFIRIEQHDGQAHKCRVVCFWIMIAIITLLSIALIYVLSRKK